MPKSAVSRILQNLFVKVVKKSAIEIISGKWGHWFYENWEKVGQWSLISGYNHRKRGFQRQNRWFRKSFKHYEDGLLKRVINSILVEWSFPFPKNWGSGDADRLCG